MTLAALAAAGLLPACGLFGAHTGTYYLSPTGSDSANGTSPQTAWRTLGRANEAILRPGNRLLLEGGQRFPGQLRLGPKDGGNPRKPVRIGSYGTGRATIGSTGDSGIVLADTSGIDIRDLVIASRHPARNGSAGVKLFSDLPANHQLRHVLMHGLDVSGFDNGISIGAQHPGAGFHDVRISDCALHGNVSAGLSVYGPAFDAAAPSYAHSRIYISGVRAFGNRGDPVNTASNTGNGIVLGSVRDATVTSTTAYGNGGANGAPHEGPIGIWAYDSANVLIEHSLSYGNQTASRRDGGGFGLDQNTSDSTLQYNLSYGNAGAGYQVYSPQNATSTGNVVRFNVSSGDALSTIDAAGIVVAGRVSRVAVYQNTVVMGGQPAHPALWVGVVSEVAVRNNIFLLTAPGPIVVATTPLAPSAALFQGNDYFTTAPGWAVSWGPAATYSSLPAWRAAAGQETVHGSASGIVADPRLTGPVLGLTIPTASGLRHRASFAPVPGSPVRGAGLDLARLFGMDPGRTDYYGRPLPGTAPSIGAG